MKENQPRSTAPCLPASRLVRAFGEESHFFLTGEDTGGRFTQWLEITPPGGGPPPHYHTGEEEWFHVIEGTVSFYRNGEWCEIAPGCTAYGPRDEVHTFRNNGSAPTRMIVTTAPAGFETFLANCGEEFASTGGPDMDRIVRLANDHGIYFADEDRSEAELKAVACAG